MFLVRIIIGLKNIFCRNFWPIGQIFGQTSTYEIPKFEEILGKNSKIRLFFCSIVGGGRSKRPNIKKTISVVALVLLKHFNQFWAQK